MEPELIVGGAVGQQVSFWVRSIDQSGNINSGNYIDCGDIYTVPPSTASNLLGNGGFELGIVGWDTQDEAFESIDNSSEAYDGDRYGKFTGDGTQQRVYWREYFPVLPGESYIADVWARTNTSGAETITVGIEWYSADKQSPTFDQTNPVIDTTWTNVSIKAIVPSNRLWARLYLQVSASLTSGQFIRIDNVVFRKLVDKVYDGTEERSIGVTADDIPLVSSGITDGKLPDNLSSIFSTATDGSILLKFGDEYIWYDPTNNKLKKSTTRPSSNTSTSGTALVIDEAS